MQTAGIINLGVGQDYFEKFKTSIVDALGNGWTIGTYDFDYTKLDHKEITHCCGALVLSPGVAKVGLLTPERARRDPGIPLLYELIEKAAEEGIPLLGVNAGHEAINCAYGWAIDKISQDKKSPKDEKVDYQKRTQLNIKDLITPYQCVDPIFNGVKDIIIELSNGYAVLPREKQNERPNQEKVIQLAKFMGYPLISKIESKAPVYGVQFNIQSGTKQIFRNFFNLARQYLERKQA